MKYIAETYRYDSRFRSCRFVKRERLTMGPKDHSCHCANFIECGDRGELSAAKNDMVGEFGLRLGDRHNLPCLVPDNHDLWPVFLAYDANGERREEFVVYRHSENRKEMNSIANNAVIVTRHSGLIEYLVRKFPPLRECTVLSHVTAKEIRGKHVIGVLPTNLAAEAASVTVIPMDIPAELRGVELDAEQVESFAGEPETYIVRSVENYNLDIESSWLDGYEGGSYPYHFGPPFSLK